MEDTLPAGAVHENVSNGIFVPAACPLLIYKQLAKLPRKRETSRYSKGAFYAISLYEICKSCGTFFAATASPLLLLLALSRLWAVGQSLGIIEPARNSPYRLVLLLPDPALHFLSHLATVS
jgi:hypothetical protein